MALSDLWTSPDSLTGALGGLGDLWGAYQGMSNANNFNNQISGALNQNLNTSSAQIRALQDQIARNQQQAQEAYNAARGNVDTQNAGLNTDIGNLSTQLSALSDPNSPYMQMARQSIERKDAAAGRRSQWGDREVQLAATLADYVGKYAPGLQNSITAARNQINQNNLGLANMYSTMNNPADRNQLALAQMLQSQQQGVNGLNTTGRAAANSATNNTSNLIGQGIKGVGSLAQLLFGGGGGTADIWGNLFTDNMGGGGWGDGSLYGNSFMPMSDYGIGTSSLGGYGYGNLPSGDYFGGGGLGGVPTTGWSGNYSGGGGYNMDDIW